MDQFKGIKRPPLLNNFSKYEDCPKHKAIHLTRKPKKNKAPRKKVKDKKVNIGSNLKKQYKIKAKVHETTPEEKSRLKMIYGMTFYNFFALWGCYIFLSFFYDYYIMAKRFFSHMFSFMGSLGPLMVDITVSIIGFICIVTPFVMCLKHRNKHYTTEYGASHYTYVFRLYFIELLVCVVAYLMVVIAPIFLMTIWPKGVAISWYSAIVMSNLISLIYLIKTYINMNRMLRNEACS